MGYFYFISLRSVRDRYFIECSRTRSSPHARPPPWEKRRVGNRELAALSQPASSPRAPRSVFSLVVHTTRCLERGAGPSESRRTKTFVFRPGAPSRSAKSVSGQPSITVRVRQPPPGKRGAALPDRIHHVRILPPFHDIMRARIRAATIDTRGTEEKK